MLEFLLLYGEIKYLALWLGGKKKKNKKRQGNLKLKKPRLKNLKKG